MTFNKDTMSLNKQDKKNSGIFILGLFVGMIILLSLRLQYYAFMGFRPGMHPEIAFFFLPIIFPFTLLVSIFIETIFDRIGYRMHTKFQTFFIGFIYSSILIWWAFPKHMFVFILINPIVLRLTVNHFLNPHNANQDNLRRYIFMKNFLIIFIVFFILVASWILFKAYTSKGRDLHIDTYIDIVNLETGLSMYKLDNGFFPTTEQGLKSLIEKPLTNPIPFNWSETGYLKNKKNLIDPWNNSYIYFCPSKKGDYEIMTFGKDGKAGGSYYDKDIYNWDLEK